MFYTIFYTTVLYVIHQLLALALKRGKTRKTVYLIDQLNVMKNSTNLPINQICLIQSEIHKN